MPLQTDTRLARTASKAAAGSNSRSKPGGPNSDGLTQTDGAKESSSAGAHSA